jgi:hypothetical protein
MSERIRAGFPVLLPCLIAAVGPPPPLMGQAASVTVEENFRAEPNGAVLGQLDPGARVTVEAQQGGWTRATVGGFVWVPSLQVWSSDDFDLVVSQPGGENLREAPSGHVLGRLVEGALLEEVERIPGWIEVRRTGWIWTPSLDIEAAAPVESSSQAGDPPPVMLSGEGWLRSGGRDAPILSGPAGDTLASIRPGSEVRVLGREGNWARVRLEGWAWVPGFAPEPPEGGGEEAPVLASVPVGELSRDFERLRGRLVELDLQFISLERAEQVRTDFYEGEPFLLTRSMDADRAFVYVAVTPERLESLDSLTPLERLRVVGRLRAGAAALTGSPILDLVDLERLP